jgi:hypothetical protein
MSSHHGNEGDFEIQIYTGRGWMARVVIKLSGHLYFRRFLKWSMEWFNEWISATEPRLSFRKSLLARERICVMVPAVRYPFIIMPYPIDATCETAS